jgi:hypothetical protein
MERILKTAREIVRTEFPTDGNGNPVCVGDREIMAFWHGDKQIVGQQQFPVIVFDSNDRQTEFATFRARMHNFNFSVLCYIKEDDSDFATTIVHDMARIVDHILSQHTRIWVFDKCIFDGEDFKSPTHLTTHSELSSYATQAETEWEARWNATHQVQGTDTPPTPPTLDSGTKYALGLYKFFNEAPSASTTPYTFKHDNGIEETTTANDVLTRYRNHYVKPVRLVSFTTIGDIQFGYVPKLDAQYLRAAELKVSCREIDPLHVFGPGNVT